MIVHNDGCREMYHMDPKEPDEPVSAVALEDEEARMVSAVMAGITYKPQPLEQLEMVLASWLSNGSGSSLPFIAQAGRLVRWISAPLPEPPFSLY